MLLESSGSEEPIFIDFNNSCSDIPSPLSEMIMNCSCQLNSIETFEEFADRLLSTISAIAVSGVYPTERSEESRILALGIEVIGSLINDRPFV